MYLQSCELCVHLTGTRMPLLHLRNLGDVSLDFAAQLLHVLLARWHGNEEMSDAV